MSEAKPSFNQQVDTSMEAKAFLTHVEMMRVKLAAEGFVFSDAENFLRDVEERYLKVSAERIL